MLILALFRQILIGLNKTFYHKTVTTQDIENYISVQSGFNYHKVYDQYLRTSQIPELSYQYDPKENIFTYKSINKFINTIGLKIFNKLKETFKNQISEQRNKFYFTTISEYFYRCDMVINRKKKYSELIDKLDKAYLNIEVGTLTLLVIGFVVYFGQKYKEYKNKEGGFKLITFIFGNVSCRGNND